MARKGTARSVLVALVLVLASAGCTTMVRSSAPSGGGLGNGGSSNARGPTLSDDGRYVVFDSHASNLVPGDTNGDLDVFRHDNVTGETIRVSLKDDESQIPTTSIPYAISGDGTHVLFGTSASLEPADTNDNFDAYVRNIPAGTTERVSIRPDGTPISPDSEVVPGIRSAWLSDDGRRALVVDLEVPADPEQGIAGVVFFRNLDTDTTTVLADDANRAVLSGDGAWMAYSEICVAPCPTPVHLVPTDGSGDEAISDDCYFDVGDITADGRSVVGVRTTITSTPCPEPGVYRLDRVTQQLTKVAVPDDDLISVDAEAARLRISNDGRYVSFIDARAIAQVTDMLTGRTIVVDTDHLGRPTPVDEGDAFAPSLSGDGRYIAFSSSRARTPGDTNGVSDVFTRYAIQPAVTAVSPQTVARGAHLTLQVEGSEYLPRVDAFFADGSGITVDGVTLVGPERVDIAVTVAPDAPTGPTDFVVRNTGGFGESRAWCPGCITVT